MSRMASASSQAKIGIAARAAGAEICVKGDAQPVKPGGPSAIEVSLDADFAPSGLVTIDVTLVETLTLAASAA
jgi:hypothetical protein